MLKTIKNDKTKLKKAIILVEERRCRINELKEELDELQDDEWRESLRYIRVMACKDSWERSPNKNNGFFIPENIKEIYLK